MLSTDVITANHGPSDAGTIETIQVAIALTIPVPESTPTSTAAANTIATTCTIDEACALTCSAWSFGLGKLTTSAIAAAPTNTSDSGSLSAPSTTSRTTVRMALNQISFGRR